MPAPVGPRDVGQAVTGQHQTAAERRKAKHLDVDEARREQEAEQRAVARREHRSPGAEARIAEHGAGGADLGVSIRHRCSGRQGFAEEEPHPRKNGHAEHTERNERGVPRKLRHHQCPDQRRRQGKDAQPGEPARQGLGALHRCVEVAHRCAGAHHQRGHRRALQAAANHQRGKRSDPGTGKRGQCVGGTACQQHRSPAKAVRQWAKDQLCGTKRERQAGERQRRIAQLRRDRRQCGQVEIRRNGLAAEQQRQQNDVVRFGEFAAGRGSAAGVTQLWNHSGCGRP